MRKKRQCKFIHFLWNVILLQLSLEKILVQGFTLSPISQPINRNFHSSTISYELSSFSLDANASFHHDEKGGDHGNIYHDRRSVFNFFLFGISMNSAGTLRCASALESVEQCNNGSIIAESAVPGAYQQICMQLPERTISLKSTGDRLTILQGTNNANGGTVSGRTGVAVWNSCLLLSRLMDILGSDILKDKTVIELGCGAGLASLVAAKLGAGRVYATDGNEEVVNLAKANIENNRLSSIVQATKLQWGLLDASEYYDTADIVIGSDLTYNSGTWRILAETVVSVLKTGGVFLYLSLGHQGFNVSGEMDGFLTVAQNLGLVELNGKNNVWPFQGGANSLTRILLDRVTKEEKVIIEATGGVKVLLLTRK